MVLRSIRPEDTHPQTDLSILLCHLEQGLSYFEQGSFMEGIKLLHQIRVQLPAELTLLGSALDALQKSTDAYLHTEQMLRDASKRFARADQEWLSHQEILKEEIHTLSLNMQHRQNVPLMLIQQNHSLAQRSPLPDTQAKLVACVSEDEQLPGLSVTCFNHFVVRRFAPSGPLVTLCRNSKGQSILRYLLTRPGHQASMDLLMADLWPDEDPETAHHKLQVAISALRRSLNCEFAQGSGNGYILYKDRCYQINPAIELQTDVNTFMALYQAGRKTNHPSTTAALYEQACHLYTGPLLVEDLYAEWSFLLREELTKMYLHMCGSLARHHQVMGHYEVAITWATSILKIDHCDEDSYRQLMRAYASLGKRSEALRQYQQCQQVLAEELGIQPMTETEQLLQSIIYSS